MISRLYLARRDLADRLSWAGAAVQRRVTFTVVQHVVGEVPIHSADDVLEALRAERYGDSPVRRDLDQSAERAETAYQHLRTESQEAGAPAPTARETAAYRVARTFRTAHYALAIDPDVAVQETVYEAAYATSSAEIVRIVSVLLDIPREPSLPAPGSPAVGGPASLQPRRPVVYGPIVGGPTTYQPPSHR